MKNIFVICLLLITGLTQAQTFDFSCTSTYGISLNGGSATLDEGSDFQLDLGINSYKGTIEFTVNDVVYTVVSDGTTGPKSLGDLTEVYVNINGGGTWTFKWVGISMDYVVTWVKIYDDEKFGDLIDYLPSSGINATSFDSRHKPLGNTQFKTWFWRTSKNAAVVIKTFNLNNVTHWIGNSSVHQAHFAQPAHVTYGSSEEDIFNGNRIDGGVYDGWVLIKNGQSVDVIAKWSNDIGIHYAMIIHPSYKWPSYQGSSSGSYRVNLYELPEETNFNN